MIIVVDLPKKTELVCGKPCLFCRFDFSDDDYHCIFLDDNPDDRLAVNLHAEERMCYDKCPVSVIN